MPKDKKDGDITPKKHRGLNEPWKPGQSGNPDGRPRGARNKLTERFFTDFLDAWGVRGKTALVEVAVQDPATFVRVAATLMSKDVNVTADVSESFVKLWALVSDGAATELADRLAEKSERSASIRH